MRRTDGRRETRAARWEGKGSASTEAEGVSSSRVGDQLELKLGMPWNGYDPRSLTRVRISLTSLQGTGRSIQQRVGWPSVVQLELFPEERSYGA